ncbi:major facilitator superfamily domain-containing protein [Plectosphaerella plurivora]|uniref:Major facilitator superfamily domain-containing protein n=1 Tax=Plectosphaerella plurivora TaxID=936078 RepID=A0A9P8VC45_9PEZI|nr:major facilitator superfamily domain-containing protein [Plectosphaerella plurivora]
MAEHSDHHRGRIIASVAATVISLACGTNYVYSAWAPQFADRLKLTSTQSNLIGLSGNLGMYLLGVPIGIFVDSRGPRPAVVAGAVLLALGYFPLHQAFDRGSGSVGLFCFFSFLTGLGGCMAFAAAVKTSALNWPHHRGTATAFPLAAFGLSAFFFSLFGGVLFPGDTGAFLATLAIGTFGLTIAGFFFLRVYSHTGYKTVLRPDPLLDSQELYRTSSEDMKYHQHRHGARTLARDEPGMSPTPGSAATNSEDTEWQTSPPSRPSDVEQNFPDQSSQEDVPADETSSLVSSSSSLPGDVYVQNSVDLDRSHRVDIRGFRLLRMVDFWQLFCIMGILTGIGLMTINNIGHTVNALWRHWDASADEGFVIAQQQMHVSILSICSFAGRLLSGVGSDIIVKALGGSRVWCLAVSSLIFSVAQLCALNILNPHMLGFVSGLSGLAYGILFGVFPSIVAETFGIHGLSQNWGVMTLSPVVSGNIFNLFYGIVFDKHSVLGPEGERVCHDGIECYQSAYLVTLSACAVGLAVTLWVIRHQHVAWAKEDKAGQED